MTLFLFSLSRAFRNFELVLLFVLLSALLRLSLSLSPLFGGALFGVFGAFGLHLSRFSLALGNFNLLTKVFCIFSLALDFAFRRALFLTCLLLLLALRFDDFSLSFALFFLELLRGFIGLALFVDYFRLGMVNFLLALLHVFIRRSRALSHSIGLRLRLLEGNLGIFCFLRFAFSLLLSRALLLTRLALLFELSRGDFLASFASLFGELVVRLQHFALLFVFALAQGVEASLRSFRLSRFASRSLLCGFIRAAVLIVHLLVVVVCVCVCVCVFTLTERCRR